MKERLGEKEDTRLKQVEQELREAERFGDPLKHIKTAGDTTSKQLALN